MFFFFFFGVLLGRVEGGGFDPGLALEWGKDGPEKWKRVAVRGVVCCGRPMGRGCEGVVGWLGRGSVLWKHGGRGCCQGFKRGGKSQGGEVVCSSWEEKRKKKKEKGKKEGGDH